MKTEEEFLNKWEGHEGLSLNDDRVRIGRAKLIWMMKQYKIDILTDFLSFLLDYGYCDSDVYCEGNSAIDRYMHPKLRNK
jgi:hypothetical protein